MLSRREKISSPAHDAIVDGDDLHMTTGSFDGDEENFSVVANASCHTRSFTFGSVDKTKVTKNHSVDENIQDGEKGGIKFSKRSLKVKKILRKLRQPRRLIPSLFGHSTNTVADYEEMIENEFGHEEEDNYVYDSDTIVSLRSSRNNVRTGQSMLVRQRAQVMSRPSTANTNREISPSSSESKNYRNSMLRGKSLILDDCSIGGMSDITEDASSFYGAPNMDHPSIRRTPMFINGDTYCINEDEDENESDSDSEEKESGPSNGGTIERAYDFRELSPLNDGIESTAGESSALQSPVSYDKEATRVNFDRMRRRVYSDSDVYSEAHRDVMNTYSQGSSDISPLNQNSNLKIQKRLKSADRSRSSIGKSLERWTPERSGPTPPCHVTAYASWPFPRTRTYSDSYIDHTPTNHEVRCPFKEHEQKNVEIQNCSLLETKAAQPSRRQSLPLFEREEQNPYQISRLRTHSDSIVHKMSVQEEILWDPRSVSILDAEITKFDESPIASQTYHLKPQVLRNEELSPSTKTIDNGNIHPRPPTSSVLATLSPTKIHKASVFIATEHRKPLQQQASVQNPSPRTLNAASMIAAALRPAPAAQLAAVPSQSPSSAAQRSDQYYWGIRDVECSESSDRNDSDKDRAMELKNLCSWSSESFDDIF